MASGGASISRAGADLTLLLMKANVPNAAVLNARSDRELALLAQKHVHQPIPYRASCTERHTMAHVQVSGTPDLARLHVNEGADGIG